MRKQKIQQMTPSTQQNTQQMPRRAPNPRLVALILPRRTATADSAKRR
jgi:hypothetical protein